MDTQGLRQQLLVQSLADLHIKMCKKAGWGRSLIRDVVIEDDDPLNFASKKKHYQSPAEFIPETKGEYLEKVMKMKDTKNKPLEWKAKGIVSYEYRIVFSRFGKSPKPDSAFYFETREEFDKMKGFFKNLQLLEKQSQDGPSTHQLLEKLINHFNNSLTQRVRALIAKRADQKKHENRGQILRKNQNLTNLRQVLVTSVVLAWK